MEFYDFDDDYLERLRAGDRETEKHFLRYFERLLRIKLRTEVSSREDAEDLSQTTFLRFFAVLHRENGIRDGKHLGAYVFGICRNVVLEWRRSRKREPEPVEDGVLEGIPGYELSALDFLTLEELQQIVRAILGELSERDRRVLREVYLEERDKDDVCRDYNVTRDNLRVMLTRARQRFREKYPDDLGDPPIGVSA